MPAQSNVHARLEAIGLVAAPAGTPPDWMTPVNLHGHHGYVSGQVAFGPDGTLIAQGRLGESIGMDVGVQCARQAAANALAVLERALGDLDAIAHLQRLMVYVACEPGFISQPDVANGASEVFFSVLADRGRHARTAIGVAALPLGSPVELDLTFALVP